MNNEGRSYEAITSDDLKQLLKVATKTNRVFFKKNKRFKPKQKSLLAIALCQGAALHFIDGKNGVKDFDIYSFYVPSSKQGNNRISRLGRVLINRDSKLSKFGKDEHHKEYVGKKADFMMREIDEDIIKNNNRDAAKCIAAYLERGRTRTATLLSRKAVVGLYPKRIFSKVIWPVDSRP